MKSVKKVKVSFDDLEAVVTYDPDVVKVEDLIKAVKGAPGMQHFDVKVKKKDVKGSPLAKIGRDLFRWRIWEGEPGLSSSPQRRRMTASFLTIFLLVSSIASGVQGVPSPDAQPIIVEPHRKLLPAGPGNQAFDVTRHIIPLSAIDDSIPRDTIPALIRPRFVAGEEARGRLKDSDRVLGVFLNGEAKAYPIRILNWHELVNDQAGGQPILVSW